MISRIPAVKHPIYVWGQGYRSNPTDQIHVWLKNFGKSSAERFLSIRTLVSPPPPESMGPSKILFCTDALLAAKCCQLQSQTRKKRRSEPNFRGAYMRRSFPKQTHNYRMFRVTTAPPKKTFAELECIAGLARSLLEGRERPTAAAHGRVFSDKAGMRLN